MLAQCADILALGKEIKVHLTLSYHLTFDYRLPITDYRFTFGRHLTFGDHFTREYFFAVFTFQADIIRFFQNTEAGIDGLAVGDAVRVWAAKNTADLLWQL